MKRVLGNKNGGAASAKPSGNKPFGWKVVKRLKAEPGSVKGDQSKLGKKADKNPVEEALGNDVILSHLFGFVGTRDLLECRLVNEKWRDIASTTLKSRDLFISNGRMLQRSTNLDLSATNAQIITANFDQLLRCIQDSKNFPFVGLHFSGWYWRVSSKNVKQFFRLFGPNIRRLILHTNFQSATSLCTLLQKSLPNVEELEVREVGNFSRKQGSILQVKGKRITLPSLKTLIISQCGCNRIGDGKLQFCSEAILAAPRLRKIQNFNGLLTDALLEAGKLHTVTSLFLTPDKFQALPYRKLAEARPRLKTLIIDRCETAKQLTQEEVHAFSEALIAILSACAGTLREIRMNPLEVVQRGRLPVLPAVEYLHIIHDVGRMRNITPTELLDTYRLFSTPTDVAATFPNLQRVRLELSVGSMSYLYRYFGNPLFGETLARLPTVKILELAASFDRDSLKELAKIFPNVEHVRVNWYKCYQTSNTVPTIWCLPRTVKKLQIHGLRFPWDRNAGMNNGTALDSFFTGIPEDICLNLKNAPKQQIDPTLLRTLPSVVDLKNLEELTVSFSYTGMLALRLLTRGPLISPVSGWYAFSQMPRLRVRFLYDFYHPLVGDMEASLRPAALYAKFAHQDADAPF